MRYLIVILLLALTFTEGRSQSKTAVQRHGQLKISGTKILDQYNHVAQLRGISLSWSIWEGRKYYNEAVVNWLADDFKVSLLRIAMAVEPEQGYLKDPEGQTLLVNRMVDAAIKKGLYVIIDWHDHHAHLHPEHAELFFAKMARRYKQYPNVIYEIFNEPERIEWPVVKDYAVRIIKAIRKSDPGNLIVVGSPSWDQDVDLVAKDPIGGFRNLAYSFHFYASDPGHQERLMKKAEEALEAGLPLFVTEWGVGEANGNGRFDREKTEKWLMWMEQNQLSWANWNVTDKVETTALLRSGASAAGNWPESALSPAGIYIREKLRELSPNKQ